MTTMWGGGDSCHHKRLVNIKDILDSEYKHKLGDYLFVNIVWTSGRISLGKEETSAAAYNFIMADSTAHVWATLYDGGNREMFETRRLQVNTRWKMAGFRFSGTERSRLSLLRTKRSIDLSYFAYNYYECGEETSDQKPLLTHVPYEFTGFNDIPWTHQLDTVVDVIGWVNALPLLANTLNGGIVQTVTVKCAASGLLGSVKLYDIDYVGRLRPNVLYAFGNLKVVINRTDLATNGLILTSVKGRTVIEEITRENVNVRLPNHCHEAFVQELLSVQCDVDVELSRLSQGLVLVDETLTRGNNSVAKHVYSNTVKLKSKTRSNCTQKAHSVITGRSTRRKPAEVDSSDEEEGSPSKRLRETDNSEDFYFYDFVGDDQPLQVKVTAATCYRGRRDDSVYDTRGVPRGLVLIINNLNYPERRVPYRHGGEHDARYLRAFFQSCFFEVTVKENVVSSELDKVIREFKAAFDDYSFGACIVFVLGHGFHTAVSMVDEILVDIYSGIIYQFSDTAFPRMKGKPKVFFILTCQDHPKSYPNTLDLNGDLNDVAVILPTSPGSKSFRDVHMGTHFVYILVDMLMKFAYKMDLESILKQEVARALRRVISDHNEQRQSLNLIWINFGCGFKKLFFYPHFPHRSFKREETKN